MLACDSAEPGVQPGSTIVAPAGPAELEARDLAAQQLAAGHPELAWDLLEPYLSEPPQSDRSTLLAGLALHRQARYARARPLLEAAASGGEADPQLQSAAHYLGWCCLQLGDIEAARSAFELHRNWQPNMGDDDLGLGLLDLEEGRLSAAQKRFEDALVKFAEVERGGANRRAERARTHAHLAEVHAAQGDDEAAWDAIQASVGAGSPNPQIEHRLRSLRARLAPRNEAQR